MATRLLLRGSAARISAGYDNQGNDSELFHQGYNDPGYGNQGYGPPVYNHASTRVSSE